MHAQPALNHRALDLSDPRDLFPKGAGKAYESLDNCVRKQLALAHPFHHDPPMHADPELKTGCGSVYD